MRVVFVTSELAPAVPGGAGTVVKALSDRLVAGGDDVTVVLVTAATVEVRDENVVVAVPSSSADPFTAASEAAADAIGRLAAAKPIDLIEVQDFDALGFSLLTRRHAIGIDTATVAVRVHGPVDLMVEAMGVVMPDLAPVAARERQVFGLADVVLVPSPGLMPVLIDRYGLEVGRVVLAPPPVETPSPVPWQPGPSPEFVALGRLSEVKGSHDVVAAAIELCARRPDVVVRLVGQDGWSASHNRAMGEWLAETIPDHLADRIRIEGRIEHSELPGRLASAWAIVTASRFESFCLAAHESRRMGLPVIVTDLPAFAGSFDEFTGAVVTSRDKLADAMERVADDADLRDRLALADVPPVGDCLEPYGRLPQRRHTRSQAALATMALQAVADISQTGSRWAGFARSVLRRIPAPVARLAVKVLPQRLKNRFRSLASWPAEQQRRASSDRNAALAKRRAAGEFPALDPPLVSVVIPVYNQGAYLADALASVYEQTMDSFEVIVVDDGSTDPATVAGVDALDWDRVQVVRQPNRGLPAARNAGMAIARGRYVVPLDADDEIAPTYLADLTVALDTNPNAAYAHCWAELYGDIEALWVTRPFNRYKMLLANSVVGCVVMRRRAWEEVGGYDETMTDGNEDWELWIRLMKAGWDQVQVPRALFRYRKHGVSMSVETEARFEQGRTAIRNRHPDLYDREALAEMKLAEYPLVTVISPDPGWLAAQSVGDVQSLYWDGAADSLERVFDEVKGKFAVVVNHAPAAAPTALQSLADVLESHPGHANAATPGGLTMWRVWALRDRSSSTDATIQVDIEADADPIDLRPGMFHRDGWSTPPGDGLRVQRQSPEEPGLLPDWVGQ